MRRKLDCRRNNDAGYDADAIALALDDATTIAHFLANAAVAERATVELLKPLRESRKSRHC
jgi:hypothetical protein